MHETCGRTHCDGDCCRLRVDPIGHTLSQCGPSIFHQRHIGRVLRSSCNVRLSSWLRTRYASRFASWRCSHRPLERRDDRRVRSGGRQQRTRLRGSDAGLREQLGDCLHPFRDRPGRRAVPRSSLAFSPRRARASSGPISGVDVPHLVASRRAEPNLRLRWMHMEPKASPAVFRTRRYQVEGDDDAVPSRRARVASARSRGDGYSGEVTMSRISSSPFSR